MSSSCTKEITLHPQAKELLFTHFRTLIKIFNDVLGHLEVDYMAIALLTARNELMFLSSTRAIESNLIEQNLWPLDARESSYEGCLNSGELMGQVPRATEIEYTGFDLEGNAICKRATGFEARIIQHEIDHLNGILFFDHVEDKETLTTYTEMQQRL